MKTRSITCALGTLSLAIATQLCTPAPPAGGAPLSGVGTSPHFRARPAIRATAENAASVITFSEYPVGTYISDQYASLGILFGGDQPFISGDLANPTSPVLSGTPRFSGAIEGYFVDPQDASVRTVVESFRLDAGYFDELGSTRLIWYDPDGRRLGQRTNSQHGIETFEITGGNIASWRFEIFQNEPAGFAIDNVSLKPATSSILFREKIDGAKEGTWGFAGDEIPGFDHCALNAGNVVYESHPGYPAGLYLSADGSESRAVSSVEGIQSVHTRKTFAFDSTTPGSTPVSNFQEIPIPAELASLMKQKVTQRMATGTGFRFINFSSLAGMEATLSPEAQKGQDNRFTCVGMVEWAAEQAGYNSGEGFINHNLEAIRVGGHVFPLLSPELLYRQMQVTQGVEDLQEWFQGLFDPVDFIITDPLGRRLGYTGATGKLTEIPNSFYSGNGKIEQFFIANPMPGTYRIQLVGVGETTRIATSNSGFAAYREAFLDPAETHAYQVWMEPYAGSPGDVTRDGKINALDVTALQAEIPRFIDGISDPGDLNGDGALTSADVTLLQQLIAAHAAAPTPKQIIADVLAAVRALPLSPVKAKRLRTQVAGKIQASLAPTLWNGQLPLNKKGLKVFTNLAQAVASLPKINRYDATAANELQTSVESLRSATRRLARDVADQALRGPISTKDSAAINKQLTLAAHAAEVGTFSSEVNAYGKAWSTSAKVLSLRR